MLQHPKSHESQSLQSYLIKEVQKRATGESPGECPRANRRRKFVQHPQRKVIESKKLSTVPLSSPRKQALLEGSMWKKICINL